MESSKHGMKLRKNLSLTTARKIENESETKKFTKNLTKKRTPHQCGLCGKKFLKYTTLLYHCKLHNGEREYKCRFSGCTEDFITTDQLAIHEQIHNVNMRDNHDHKCSFCHKEFSRKSGLILHMRIHAPVIPEEPIVRSEAVICTLWFPTGEGQGPKKIDDTYRLQLDAASRRSLFTGVKPFCCEGCGKSFVLRIDLQSHNNSCPKPKS